MDPVPVVVFLYNRPVHSKQTIESLIKNEGLNPSNIILCVDRSNLYDPKNEEVIRIAQTYRESHQMQVWLNKKNKGLKNQIIESITRVFEEHKSCVVLEDDIETHIYFYKFMCYHLFHSEYDSTVWHISGYVDKEYGSRSFLHLVPSCWGWGTWADRWANLQTDPSRVWADLKNTNSLKRFDFNYSGVFLPQISLNVAGDIETWAILWYAAIFLNTGYCIHPPRSLTRNIGFDGTGTNCQERSIQSTDNFLTTTEDWSEFISIDRNVAASYAEFAKYYRSLHKSNFKRLMIIMLIRIFNLYPRVRKCFR